MKNKVTLDIIRQEINKWDPLAKINATPSDGYNTEADNVYERLGKYPEINDAVISGVVYVVFTRSFRDKFTKNFTNRDCFIVARNILEAANGNH